MIDQGMSRRGLAMKFLQNMREQAHKAGYDLQMDLKGFKFQVEHGFLTYEDLKTSKEELEKLEAKNKLAKGK
jgi:hypothetical protein